MLLRTVLSLALIVPMVLCGRVAKGDFAVGYNVEDINGISATHGEAGSPLQLSVVGATTVDSGNADLDALFADGFQSTEYIEFGFANDSIRTWDLSQVDFQWSAQASTELLLRASVNGGAFSTVSTLTAFGEQVALGSDFDLVNSVTFRIHNNVNTGLGSSSISLVGDHVISGAPTGINLSVQGTFTAVPEPTALGLLSSLGACVLFRRRRN